jgi:hypothetical protein
MATTTFPSLPAADLRRRRSNAAAAHRQLEALAIASGRLSVLDWVSEGRLNIASWPVPSAPPGTRFCRGLRLSSHAIERWSERVAGSTDLAAAVAELDAFVSRAARRSRPRNWMAHVNGVPGDLYLYDATAPGVCAIVRDATVITVIVRDRAFQAR